VRDLLGISTAYTFHRTGNLPGTDTSLIRSRQMATFYFHLADGILIDEDREGFEFETEQDAANEAVRAAREMALDMIEKNEPIHHLTYVVQDAEHRVVAQVPLLSVIRVN
jgi:hypothetical protein